MGEYKYQPAETQYDLLKLLGEYIDRPANEAENSLRLVIGGTTVLEFATQRKVQQRIKRTKGLLTKAQAISTALKVLESVKETQEFKESLSKSLVEFLIDNFGVIYKKPVSDSDGPVLLFGTDDFIGLLKVMD